jgi:hypothetical protein
MTIEVDARKSPLITFFGTPCGVRTHGQTKTQYARMSRYCCVARDERTGQVFGERACASHRFVLTLEATRTYQPAQRDVSATSEVPAPSAG